MRYDIYFHNDFDGVVSSAILRNFLKVRGDEIKNYFSITHDFRIKKIWPKLKFKNPTIIVDFLYHPNAAFWFDHHETSFLKPGWRKKFFTKKNNDRHYLNSGYSSCSHFVFDTLKKDFRYKPPAFFKSLIKWADFIDGAKYASAKQTVKMKEPIIKLSMLIDESMNHPKTLDWLIKILSEKSLNKVLSNRKIKAGLNSIIKKRNRAIKFFSKNIRLFDKHRVAFIDLSFAKILDLRYMPFYLYPELFYAIFLKKDRFGFHLTVSNNPWHQRKNVIDIGSFLKKYGGGGHKNVGGIAIRDRKKLKKMINRIISRLSSH